MNTIKRFSVAFLFATAGFATSTLALAETPKADHQCEGHGKGEGKGHGRKQLEGRGCAGRKFGE